jgi:2'-5' RNA ligase
MAADDDFEVSKGLSVAYLAAHHAATKELLPRDVRSRLHKMALPRSGGRSAQVKQVDADETAGSIPAGGFADPRKKIDAGPLVPTVSGSTTPVMMAEDGLQSAYVAHFPPPDVAMSLNASDDDTLPEGSNAQDPDDMHMTVVFCGKLSSDDFDKLRDALADFTAKEPSIPAAVAGAGHFMHSDPRAAITKSASSMATTSPDQKVVHGLVDAPGLGAMRERLVAHLKAAGVPVPDETHGFTPHISIAAVPNDSDYTPPAIDPVNPPSYAIDSLTASMGDERHTYPLAGDVAKAESGGEGDGDAADVPPAVALSSGLAKSEEFTWTVPIIKSERARQVVTGLVLVPGQLDSQGDRASAEEIEKTAFEFLASYNENGLAHRGDARPDVKVVESYIAPQTFIMKGDDGKDHTVPKGTWIMSTKLPDDLWSEALEGKWASYSVQGHALRHPVAA